MVDGVPLTGTTRLAAVIGSPVRHSRSPAIHNAGFAAAGLDWAYLAFEVAPGRAAAALDAVRALGLGGLSVTTPHKDDVAAAVDELDPVAAALGAVNCVVPLDGDRLLGANTDVDGAVHAVRAGGLDPRGARVCVLGAGGAARACVLGLAGAGAAEVLVLNRTPARGEAAAALAGERGTVAGSARDADVVVNATTVGMGGTGDLPLDPGLLRPGQVVVELVYHPLATPLLAAARAAGCTTVDGLAMLVGQAAAAFERWTGVPAPLAAMDGAARATFD